MPYCIHCGVKVNHRHTDCPLCNIELEYTSKREKMPPLYPREVHKISILKGQTNSREWIAIHFMGFFITLVILLTTGINVFMTGGLSWSLILSLSLLFFYTTFSAYMHLKRNPLLLYTSINAALGLYLYILDILTTGGSWFISFGLPCLISLQLISLILKLVLKRVKTGLLKTGIILLVTNIFLIIINEITTSGITWSLITAAIFIPTAIFLKVLDFILRPVYSHQATKPSSGLPPAL